MLQYQNKWTFRWLEQVPRTQYNEDRQRTDIDENDSVNDPTNGLWQCVLRPLCLGRSESDHFNTPEGEDDGGACGQYAGNAPKEKASTRPKNGYATLTHPISNPQQQNRAPA